MFRRQLVAVVLALLVLVTSSRAATLCVERDGSTRIELVGSACCAEPIEAPASDTVGAADCAGCDDAPLNVTARLTSHDGPSVVAPLPSIVVGVLEPSVLEPRPCGCLDDDQPPRAARPSRLRC